MRHLIDRAMTGDPDAFNALAAHVGDDMFAIARRILRDRERAADAVQATCYRQGRRERRERDGRQLAPPAPPHPDHASAIADRDAIERAFLRLSPQHRAVVVLHHYRGLPLVEVASTLGIPVGTAYSRLHYAQERLRSVLTEEIEPVTSRGMA